MLARSTEYAIRALVYIELQNRKHRRPGVIEIAKQIGAPEAFSAKILQTMTRYKLVDSKKGRGGGFFFHKEQESLTLYDVIHVMEGDACFTKCGFGFRNCNDRKPCPLHERYVRVREDFLNIAKTETIASVTQKIVNGKAYLRSEVTDLQIQI